MASYRKLPSGKWQAQIKHGGRRYYRTDPLKRVVQEWAADTEAALRRGTFVDPADGRLTVGEWWARWETTRVVEASTAAKRRSQWTRHVEPRFGRWELATVSAWDVEEWVADMVRAKVGATTLAESVRLLGQLLESAVLHKRISVNPVTAVKVPSIPKHTPRIMDIDAVDRVVAGLLMVDLAQAGVPRKGRRPRVPDLVSQWMVRTMTDTGLRYGEAAGLHGFRVDLKRRRLHVREVLTKAGTVKAYPKTHAGVREVPLTDEMVEVLGPLVSGGRRDGLVFTRESGAPMAYDNWLKRSWRPALGVARLEDPQPTPHDCRHSYGTWLADHGVPAHQIKDLMGHRSMRAVEIYINTSEARMEAARAALGARRAHGPPGQQKDPGRREGESGA